MSHTHVENQPHELYGMIAEFETPEGVLLAAKASRQAGYISMDAYSPLPVEGLAEAIGFTRNHVASLVFLGGLFGGCAGFFMLWYSTSVYFYPINIGGRPLLSWPMFIPITFEMTVLFGAFAAVLGMLGLNGLPRPNHPVFGAKGFDRASRDRFFLAVMSNDPQFSLEGTKRFLEGLGPVRVSTVDR